jgi:hypothetical protein
MSLSSDNSLPREGLALSSFPSLVPRSFSTCWPFFGLPFCRLCDGSSNRVFLCIIYKSQAYEWLSLEHLILALSPLILAIDSFAKNGHFLILFMDQFFSQLWLWTMGKLLPYTSSYPKSPLGILGVSIIVGNLEPWPHFKILSPMLLRGWQLFYPLIMSLILSIPMLVVPFACI